MTMLTDQLRDRWEHSAAPLVALALASIACGVAPSVAAADRADRACRTGEVQLRGKAIYLTKQRGDLFGCRVRDRAGRALAYDDEPWTTYGTYAISGRMAAVESIAVGQGPGALREIVVVDMVRQRKCQTVRAGTDTAGARPAVPPPNVPGQGEPVTDLVVAPTGAVAFIAGPGYGPFDPNDPLIAPWDGFEVIVSDIAGSRQLEAEAGIAPSSLSREARTVRWQSGGARREAQLSAQAIRCRGRIWT